MVNDVKRSFDLTNLETIKIEQDRLLEKWKLYLTMVKRLFDDGMFFTYIMFPISIYKSIKSTNRIESLSQKNKTINFTQTIIFKYGIIQSNFGFENNYIES